MADHEPAGLTGRSTQAAQGGDGGEVNGETGSIDAWDPYVAALTAFYGGQEGLELRLRDDLGNDDLIPVARFFRKMGQLPQLEEVALGLCHGHVLDIGAGAGVHSLLLQEQRMSVTALEPHRSLAEMLRQRGVERVLEGTLSEVAAAGTPTPTLGPAAEGAGFDTLLLLMNGWGLAGSVEAFPTFLDQLELLLAPGGQVLADSTPPAAFLDEETDAGTVPHHAPYSGDVQFQWEFQSRKGAPFPFLFLDTERLHRVAEARGWKVEIVAETEDGAYLSRLTRAGLPSPFPTP